ncbi:MAG: SAVED domain-containing protein [Oceanospirillaceae bacterium]|nr:SAVED domain-containing protein [Oceanospirillaceae bacterium]
MQDVHICCAAQSSFNFAIGQQITKNHLTCYVHEYVNGADKPYPWALNLVKRVQTNIRLSNINNFIVQPPALRVYSRRYVFCFSSNTNNVIQVRLISLLYFTHPTIIHF